MLPDAVWRNGVIGGEVLCALAGGDDLEAARPRPVDLLGDQRRLVAIGHRIDDALVARLSRQQRPGEHVGLDIDHDDRRPRLDRGERVGDAGGGVARRLDHDIDGARVGGRLAVGDEAGARDPRLVPADAPAGGPRPLRVEIGDDGDLEAGNGRHLRQEHRAEFSGADQAGTDGLAALAAGFEEVGEVHPGSSLVKS